MLKYSSWYGKAFSPEATPEFSLTVISSTNMFDLKHRNLWFYLHFILTHESKLVHRKSGSGNGGVHGASEI